MSCSAFTIPMIGPAHGAAGWPSIRFAPATAPSWMTTTWTFTPCRRSRRDSAAIRSASSTNSSPSVAPALTSSGVVFTVAPITPTRTPLTRTTVEASSQSGVSPVSSSRMFADR